MLDKKSTKMCLRVVKTGLGTHFLNNHTMECNAPEGALKSDESRRPTRSIPTARVSLEFITHQPRLYGLKAKREELKEWSDFLNNIFNIDSKNHQLI